MAASVSTSWDMSRLLERPLFCGRTPAGAVDRVLMQKLWLSAVLQCGGSISSDAGLNSVGGE